MNDSDSTVSPQTCRKSQCRARLPYAILLLVFQFVVASREPLSAQATYRDSLFDLLVFRLQEGTIKIFEYDYVIAHPNIITDLVPIRGLMKKKFPTLKAGTLDTDLTSLVKKFAGGVQYRVVRDEKQDNFGSVEVAVGRVSS